MNWEHFLICVKSIFPDIDISADRRLIQFPTYGTLIDKECEEFWTLFPNGTHCFVTIAGLTETEVITSLKTYKKNNSIFRK